MLRIRGDRTSLLAALAADWAESQLAIPLAIRAPRGGAEPQAQMHESRGSALAAFSSDRVP
jgi:hypothetical protein